MTIHYIAVEVEKTPEQIERERQWEEETRTRMYNEGYRDGMRMYADNDPGKIDYGITYYADRVKRLGEYGAYEQGICDALATRVASRIAMTEAGPAYLLPGIEPAPKQLDESAKKRTLF